MPRDDVLSLVRAIFQRGARHDAVQQTSSGVNEEYARTLRNYRSCVIMNWGRAHNLKRWILRAQNYAIYLARLMCLFMYERLSVHRRLPDHHFSTLIPQLSSFHRSVRVKWKSEVLHFRSFSPFTEQGRTLFAVLDMCAVTMARTVTFPRSI